MSDSTSPSAVFLPDFSLGRLPPSTRMRTVNLSLSLGPFPSYGSCAWDFRDDNREASSTLPHIPPFSWDSIPNSNKCDKSEVISVFEDWNCSNSPTSIVMGEDDVQNLLISPKSLGSTPFSTTSDSDDNGPSLGSENDVHGSLTTSPQTPSLISEGVAHMERSSKFTQLSIDTTSKSLEVRFTLVSSISFLDSPCWNPLIYDNESDIPSDCNHFSGDFSP